MDNLNLPKTKNRILAENYLSEVDALVDKLEYLKENLPNEIAKKSIEIFKQDIIDVKGELIYMSNNHKNELEKLSTKITDYITAKVTNSLDNNSAIITNSVNNNIYALLGFGLFCGTIGGMVVYLAKFFIG